ncbi:CocE/NonD family hydrolase [Streptomyces sp. gb14]|uniref:CocE/NonD family hydrolase n=1 Tax=Streptomyces sp. gb14 TaxID=1827753 RepID=UPI000BF03D97|nr:CocE/NonD family hydrolase [Streptomyces sp. gb14]
MKPRRTTSRPTNRAAQLTTAGLVTALALTVTLVAPAAPAAAAPQEAGNRAAIATATDGVTHEENERVPEGAVWTQHYFPSSDGSDTELHADVLLPEGLAEGEKVPVILSAGAYFGHAGEIVPEGHERSGPSARFQDFMKGTDLFDKGYAFVMVDTRGFGGSTGCLDFGGPGDRADVEAAIDWSADRPWSTGAVGMYGKSFDALTGLIGNNADRDALKAVVAQEPVWDAYRLIHANGVPRPNVVATATTYNGIAAMPGMKDDDARYRANADYEKKHPECFVENSDGYRIADPADPYWTERDQSEKAEGTDTPLFFTQGFTESNTKPEGMKEFLANHRGPKRGWLGPWDHVRGNEKDGKGRLEMGRAGWFEETMSFYDQYLKGEKPTAAHPPYAIQDSTGTWRAQKTWPEADRSVTVPLGDGVYVDSGKAPPASGKSGEASGEASVKKPGRTPGASYVVRSRPLDRPTRITGTPRISMTAEGEGNVMVKLYDVGEDGKAVMFDEQVSRLDTDRLALDLKSADWTLAAGHTLAVEIGTIGTGDWLDTPSRQTVRITNARLDLSLDDPSDDTPTAGERAPYLDTYISAYTTRLPTGKPTFTLPAPKDRTKNTP